MVGFLIETVRTPTAAADGRTHAAVTAGPAFAPVAMTTTDRHAGHRGMVFSQSVVWLLGERLLGLWPVPEAAPSGVP